MSAERVKDSEYVYAVCYECGDRCKLAKNRGARWTTDYPQDWLASFLLEHGNCRISLEASDT